MNYYTHIGMYNNLAARHHAPVVSWGVPLAHHLPDIGRSSELPRTALVSWNRPARDLVATLHAAEPGLWFEARRHPLDVQVVEHAIHQGEVHATD